MKDVEIKQVLISIAIKQLVEQQVNESINAITKLQARVLEKNFNDQIDAAKKHLKCEERRLRLIEKDVNERVRHNQEIELGLKTLNKVLEHFRGDTQSDEVGFNTKL